MGRYAVGSQGWKYLRPIKLDLWK